MVVALFFFLNFILFIYFWYVSLSLLWPLPLQSTGSGRAGSAAMAHGPSRSAACGIFPDRGTNPHPLHQQADSQPLCHQGSPSPLYILASFVKDKVTICAWVYLLAFYLVPLIYISVFVPVPYCLDYCSFVV